MGAWARDINLEYGHLELDEEGINLIVVFDDPADKEIVDCITQDECTLFFREDL